MATTSQKRLRVLIFWTAAEFEGLLTPMFLQNPELEIEIVSGNRGSGPSPHAASLGRLWSLRKRLVRGEFDIVICNPIHNTPWPPHKRLATRIAQALRFLTYKRSMLDTFWVPWMMSGSVGRKVPLAVIDYLDTSYVLPKELPLLRAATLYFKTNLYFWPRRSLMPLETYHSMRRITPLVGKLRPMTNGVSKNRIPETVRPMQERDIDICFTGTIRPGRNKNDIDPFPELTFNPVRKNVYERCEKLKGKYNVFCIDGTVPKEQYIELLQRSKLVVCTESFGCETSRHYDVAAAGAIPLVNWPYAQHYMQMEPDVHAVYFSLIGNDFERTVARVLADPTLLEKIAQNTRAITRDHKTRDHLGKMVIAETLREHARLVEAGLP